MPAPRYETVDEEPLRDPFEDQGYGESAAGGRYGAIENPYEAIRKVRNALSLALEHDDLSSSAR